MTDYFEAVKTRRSHRNVKPESPVSDDRIQEIVEFAVKHTPTAFNAQGGRVVLALGKHHEKVWDIVKDALKEVVPEKKWDKTAQKISMFKDSYGTVLFFNDESVLEKQQEKMPLYADKFALWADQTQGMLQHIVWTAFATEGIGASLQHYNPLIDEAIRDYFNLNESWTLHAQMPFGAIKEDPGEKSFEPLEKRLKVFK